MRSSFWYAYRLFSAKLLNVLFWYALLIALVQHLYEGEMQHPNYRKVENGQWLYAKVSTRSFPQFSTDNWIPDEDPYDMGYAEMVT